jgi:hypothetical protein
MERVELRVPINLSDVKSSRELLMLFHNPLETCLDFHRLGQGLFPNPTMQKKGSKSELLWQAATADILLSNATDAVKSLVSPGILLPVSGIVDKDGNSELSIYKSASKVIVKGLELKHDGGVVNYMIDTGRKTIKRQVRVLVSEQELSADTKKKKKGEANDVEKLMAFSKIKVSFSCPNQKNEFVRARAAGTEKFNVKRLPSESIQI